MADESIKISQLPQASNAAQTDRVLILRDPAGTPSVRTINVNALAANLHISSQAPTSNTSAGQPGMIRYDNFYLYVCVANNTWKRTQLSNWP